MAEINKIDIEDESISDEDRQIIRESAEVSLTVNTQGWDIIKREILLNCKDYENLIIDSKSMEETYGCAKTLSGLKFVLSLVDDIINQGQEVIDSYIKKE